MGSIFFTLRVVPMSMMRRENNFKKALKWETSKIKLRQYVSLLKSSNFSAMKIKCFTVRTSSFFALGQTWFSCSLYSFHSEQAEQKSSALEHLCSCTLEYSIFRGGVDRTVTWPIPKQDGRALSTLYWDIFLSFPIGSDNYSYRKNIVICQTWGQLLWKSN